MIGAALRKSGGKLDAGFQAALKATEIASVRGRFSFGNNHGPVLDWFELAVVKGADGTLGLKTERKFRTQVPAAYSAECGLK